MGHAAHSTSQSRGPLSLPTLSDILRGHQIYDHRVSGMNSRPKIVSDGDERCKHLHRRQVFAPIGGHAVRIHLVFLSLYKSSGIREFRCADGHFMIGAEVRARRSHLELLDTRAQILRCATLARL